MWVTKWKQSGLNIPEKLMDTFKSCDPVFSPNIYVLLHLALTLPITSCECERSFGQLKLIKTSHCSTVSASRLSGLSLMKMNRTRRNYMINSPTEMKSLVASFHQLHPRKLKLPFMMADYQFMARLLIFLNSLFYVVHP